MKLKIKFSKKWLILVIVILLLIAYLIIDNAVRPTILSLSEARLRAIAVKAMNDAVRDTIGSSNITYSDLINIEKDDEGKVTLISANTVLMNNLAASTAMAAQENILSIGEQGIKIPIGTIIGGQLLTGRGPSISIKFEPVGSVTTDLNTEFKEAGINQTKQKIYLTLHSAVRILLGNSSQTVEISSQVLISETVIVGDVPQGYYKGTDNQLLNLLPNAQIQ